MVCLVTSPPEERSLPVTGRVLLLQASRSQILAHFFEALRTEASNGQQIVDALESAVRFAHLQNLFRRRRPDAGNLLQFFGSRGVVYGLRRRLLLGERTSAEKAAQNKRNANCESPPRHGGYIMR